MTYKEYISDLILERNRVLIKLNKAVEEMANEGIDNQSGFGDMSLSFKADKYYREWQAIQGEINSLIALNKKQLFKLEDEVSIPKGAFVIKYVILEDKPEGNKWIHYVGYGGYFELREEADNVCAEMNKDNIGRYFVEARKIPLP